MSAAIAPRGNFKANHIEIVRNTPFRQVGFGALPGANEGERQKRFIGAMQKNLCCPTATLPNIDSVTIHYGGPLTAAEVQAGFGAVHNVLGASQDNPPPGATQVDTTFADPGKFQTFALVCAIQWRYDLDPIMFTAKGNGYTTPTTGVAKPVSPDVFVAAVSGGSATGDLGTTLALGATGLTPAVLQWAWWTEMAFYYMTRGYNLRWQYGHNCNILLDNLRYTAFVPSSAQEGSASSSEIDLDLYVRRLNAYYRTALSTSAIFLQIDRVRAGNESLGGTAGQSVFHPSRAFETVGGTYGGGGLRPMLRGNSEFRRLTTPFLSWPGVALGLTAQVSSTDDMNTMQTYLDASCSNALASISGGGIPASFTDDVNINSGPSIGGTAGTTGVEPSLDSAGPVANSLQLPAQRQVFKGGPFRISNAFKGWEISPEQAGLLRDANVRNALTQSGCMVGWQGI